MVNAQEYLNNNYAAEEREKITDLNISEKKLEGKLDLSGFTNLEVLYCHGNKLTELDLTKCKKLTVLDYSNNRLTYSDLSQNLELKKLSVENNNLTSLVFIQPLTKLKELDIRDNNITNGLEYLPLNLKEFLCDDVMREELYYYSNNLSL